MTRRSRAGLTVVELLVVVAIIGILAGLLLPAILQARAASRRSQCASNLKQLAQAVQSFHGRMDCLPPYWGAIRGGGGEMFGGWLLYLLPDLDQQAAYDQVRPFGQMLPPSFTTSISVTDWQETTTSTPTGRMLPARPPSADFQPARSTTGTAFTASGLEVIYPIVIPQVGDPGEPARPEVTVIVTGSVLVTRNVPTPLQNFGGLSVDHARVTSALSLPVVLDPEDGGPTRSPTRSSATPSGYENAPLTNYQANAHVLTRFPLSRFVLVGGTGIQPNPNVWNQASTILPIESESDPSAELAGYFSPPLRWGPTGVVINNDGTTTPNESMYWGLRPGTYFNQFNNYGWRHNLSASIGPEGGRRFAHVVDGLSNTFLFAEGMRQCDAGLTYRHAFLPSGPGGTSTTPNWFNEHAFGILPSVRTVVPSPGGGAMISGTTRADVPPFGHTLMFQTQPQPVDCNPKRLQALHGNFLMTAMCDGSVRAISSLVSRREPIGAAASGRDTFGTNRGDYRSRGGQAGRKDGVWDMLIMPQDPQENVLSNTGEVGRERGPDDPPL